MALKLPETAKEISQKAKVDVKRELAQSDPFVARHYLGAIISGLANRVFEFYAALTQVEVENNPFTATINLVRWAAVWGITRTPGQVAAGSIFVDSSQTGEGTTIPGGTQFTSSDGGDYTSQGDFVLSSTSISADGQTTRVGTTAFFRSTADHGLASNALCTFTGADQAGYNLVDVPVTVTGLRTVEYEILSSEDAASTGAPRINLSGAAVLVSAADSGAEFNLDADATLDFVTPIAGVENSGQVIFSEVINGLDPESDTALRARLLDRIQNPVTPFNVANITAVAKEIAGVTRVFVQEKTPLLGQVTIYFMRDEDDDPIPTGAQVTTTKTRILTIKPANVADNDVIVAAPIAASANFTFTALSPDTPTMRIAITEALTDYFKEIPEVGVTVQEDAYRSAIFNTFDPADGTRVASFTLSLPTIMVNAQDEDDWDNSPTSEGAFVAGASHSGGDVLTMANGVLVTVDTVSGGAVTEFTIDSTTDRGTLIGVNYAQASTTGSGTGFQLIPDTDNMTLADNLVAGPGYIRTLGTVVYNL